MTIIIMTAPGEGVVEMKTRDGGGELGLCLLDWACHQWAQRLPKLSQSDAKNVNSFVVLFWAERDGDGDGDGRGRRRSERRMETALRSQGGAGALAELHSSYCCCCCCCCQVRILNRRQIFAIYLRAIS